MRFSLGLLLANVLKLRFRFRVVRIGGDALLIFLFCLVELPKLDEDVAESASRACEVSRSGFRKALPCAGCWKNAATRCRV